MLFAGIGAATRVAGGKEMRLLESELQFLGQLVVPLGRRWGIACAITWANAPHRTNFDHIRLNPNFAGPFIDQAQFWARIWVARFCGPAQRAGLRIGLCAVNKPKKFKKKLNDKIDIIIIIIK